MPNQPGRTWRLCIQAYTQGTGRTAPDALAVAMGDAPADLHALDDVDRRRVAEELHQSRLVVHQPAVARAARRGDAAHERAQFPFARGRARRLDAIHRHREDRLLEAAQRNAPQAVAVADALALLRRAQASAGRAVGRVLHQLLDRPAAAARGPAAAIEEREVDARLRGRRHQLDLGLVDRVARGRDADRLVALGIAEQHGLAARRAPRDGAGSSAPRAASAAAGRHPRAR